MRPDERKAVEKIWGGIPPIDLEVELPRKPRLTLPSVFVIQSHR